MTTLYILISVAILLLVWFFLRPPRPAVPPLSIDPDDPLMKEAMQQARDSMNEFLQLFEERPGDCRVKVPLITSAGELEYLWAEARKRDGDNLEVLLITPPVTHTGPLERVQQFPLKDVVDWTVSMNNGRIKGGYTMRVMFIRGREQWGDLPAELKAEESKYI